jgi:hypothetical protein
MWLHSLHVSCIRTEPKSRFRESLLYLVGSCTCNAFYNGTGEYSLRPAIQVVLGFKRCLRKQVVLASVMGVILYQSRSTALIISISLAPVGHYHTKTINKQTVGGGCLRTKDEGAGCAAGIGSCINKKLCRPLGSCASTRVFIGAFRSCGLNLVSYAVP